MRSPAGAFAALILAHALSGRANAQVMVAPTALFTSQQAPFGTLLVANRSDEPQEVAVDFHFGYPASDSLGELHMVYGDTLPPARFAMDGWVRAFPRRFVLGPGQEQLVRVLARPPATIEEGTYWSRLVVTSVGRTPILAGGSETASANVLMRIEQVTVVLYRHGRLSTSIAIGEPQIRSDSAATTVQLPLVRGGNSPFFGQIRAVAVNARQKTAGETLEYIAVYADLTRRLSLPPLPPGDYVLEITIAAARPDIAHENIVHIPDVIKRVHFHSAGASAQPNR